MRKSLSSLFVLASITLALATGSARAQLDDNPLFAGPQPEPPSVPELRAQIKDALGQCANAANNCFMASSQWNSYARQIPSLAAPARQAAQFYNYAGSLFSTSSSMLGGALKALDKGDLLTTAALVNQADIVSRYADQYLTAGFQSAPFHTAIDDRADDAGGRAIIAILRTLVLVELLV